MGRYTGQEENEEDTERAVVTERIWEEVEERGGERGRCSREPGIG